MPLAASSIVFTGCRTANRDTTLNSIQLASAGAVDRRIGRASLLSRKHDQCTCHGSAGLIMHSEMLFGMLAINPKQGANLTWKFIQYYDDGTKEELIGPLGSRLPSPALTLKRLHRQHDTNRQRTRLLCRRI